MTEVPFWKQFEALFAQPVGMLLAFAGAAGIVLIVLRVAMTAERRQRFIGLITGRNGRWAFLLAILAWVAYMLFVTILPPSAHGSLQLIGLLAGFFIFMGFTWSVIGE